MIRKNKLYSRPRKAYEKKRIAGENALLERYALKNKREVWKALAKVNYLRRRAMALARASIEEQNVLFQKLNSIGIPVKNTSDVLALRVEDILERRLPSVIFKKGLAATVRQARQFVVHKKVLIDGRAIAVPSYLVPLDSESLLKVKQMKQKKQNLEQQTQYNENKKEAS